MNRIKRHRDLLGRPTSLIDMNLDQMLQERSLIKTELIQLKRFTEKCQRNVSRFLVEY